MFRSFFYPGECTGSFLCGAREVLPLALGAAVYGLAFGLLATQARMTELEAGLMGGFVFAGSAQIIALERLIAGAGAAVAVIAGIALNLRLLLITASLRDVFAGRPWWQVALGVHLTVDENWALILSARAKGQNAGYSYLIGAGITVLLAWCWASVAGVFFATALPEPTAIGMDFAFVAAFIAICRSLWRGKQDIAPWFVAFIVVFCSIRLVEVDPSWALILGGLSGACMAGVCNDE
ncbi:AzlC family ABC transporter permease [Aliamphritea spongicola]|uniref:AzlC family ABC transporter permease n=1 Tax=Aliamphritea spongicola TaxID=707589 RepID=UPI00196AB2B1|nr:AzlC family ABC transporter permease [Aliamphritea spongicola]